LDVERCDGMKNNLKKIKVISISRQSSPLQIMIDETQLEFQIFKAIWVA
jgi:hypothetical protein